MIARIDYHGVYSHHVSFNKGEKLEVYRSNGFWWEGTSLKSGYSGVIPRSFVQSVLESLQLFQFVMTEQMVSLPTLQKIRNAICCNDEKASLFLNSIEADPILLDTLRGDKKQYDEGEVARANEKNIIINSSILYYLPMPL